jgi:hydroxyacylglutathione hydrolase
LSLRIETIRTEGLGDSTHILIHDGVGIVVDPQRDIDRFERILNETGADLRIVLETHVHNDYVSGGLDLSRHAGAELVMPAGAAPVFRHRPAFHREDIDLGPITVRPLHTPGHTPEHMSYLVLVEGREQAVFSGGCLLVGSAGRSDLLGEERAESLARLQYGSVRRLATLPDEVGLYPTHGAGSFCTTSGAGDLISTIGDEKMTNSVLAYEDEDAFVKGQLSGLVPYPSYYRHMAPINLRGLAEPDLSVPLLDSIPEGVTVIDARPRHRYAAGHLPGVLGIELRNSFGTWVGWLTEPNSPLVLILDEDQDADEAIRQLIRIGYDDVRGIVRNPRDGITRIRTVNRSEYAKAARSDAQLLDVRAPNEWESGIVEGSVLSYLPDLAERTPPGLDPSQPVWVGCGSGFRAAIAAAILQDRGFETVLLIDDGTSDVLHEMSETS